MGRKTYSLSTETIKVLNGKGAKVAKEYGCEPEYIYQILGKTETDPFAKFEWLFDAACAAGCDVSPWLNRMEAIRAKYKSDEPKCVDTETAKLIKESSDVAVAAIENKTPEQRLVETDQLIFQAEQQRRALIHEIAARSNPVSYDTRNRVRDIKNGRDAA